MAFDEDLDFDVEEDEESTAVAVVHPEKQLFLPSISKEQIEAFKDQLTMIKKTILTPQIDYEVKMIKTQPRTIFYRSGYEKIARFFGISTSILKQEYREFKKIAKKVIRDPITHKITDTQIITDAQGNPVLEDHFAYEFTVRGSCGKVYHDAVGACSSDENKAFNHPVHDIMATAHTRAKGRAICSMIGAGLSFEEIADVDEIKKKERPKSAFDLKKPTIIKQR